MAVYFYLLCTCRKLATLTTHLNNHKSVSMIPFLALLCCGQESSESHSSILRRGCPSTDHRCTSPFNGRGLKSLHGNARPPGRARLLLQHPLWRHREMQRGPEPHWLPGVPNQLSPWPRPHQQSPAILSQLGRRGLCRTG